MTCCSRSRRAGSPSTTPPWPHAWRYFFSYRLHKDRPNKPDGVEHGGEVAFVLGTLNLFEKIEAVGDFRKRLLQEYALVYPELVKGLWEHGW